MLPNWHILPVSFNTNQRFTVEYSDTLLATVDRLEALGPAAKDFVIAGAQAIKFTVKDARGTKDVDFILNVIALRTP
jgi:hypothetical protein